MFFKELVTDRLLLKNISMCDREFVFAHFSNNEINRYLFDAEPVTDYNGADEIINSYLQPEPKPHHRWVLVKKATALRLAHVAFITGIQPVTAAISGTIYTPIFGATAIC